MTGELNSDWVLWGSILTVIFSVVAFIAFGWKFYKNMDSSEDSNHQQ